MSFDYGFEFAVRDGQEPCQPRFLCPLDSAGHSDSRLANWVLIGGSTGRLGLIYLPLRRVVFSADCHRAGILSIHVLDVFASHINGATARIVAYVVSHARDGVVAVHHLSWEELSLSSSQSSSTTTQCTPMNLSCSAVYAWDSQHLSFCRGVVLWRRSPAPGIREAIFALPASDSAYLQLWHLSLSLLGDPVASVRFCAAPFVTQQLVLSEQRSNHGMIMALQPAGAAVVGALAMFVGYEDGVVCLISCPLPPSAMEGEVDIAEKPTWQLELQFKCGARLHRDAVLSLCMLPSCPHRVWIASGSADGAAVISEWHPLSVGSPISPRRVFRAPASSLSADSKAGVQAIVALVVPGEITAVQQYCYLALGGWDARVHILRFSAGGSAPSATSLSEVGLLKYHSSSISFLCQSAAFSGSLTLLATGNDDKISSWRIGVHSV